eukprot:6399037-Prymnesium_polylepis.1
MAQCAAARASRRTLSHTAVSHENGRDCRSDTSERGRLRAGNITSSPPPSSLLAQPRACPRAAT